MSTLKILIPTDFSVQAEFAYLMVQKLREKANVEIHFVHVLNVPDTVTMSDDGKISTCGEIDVNYVVQQKQIAERKLENLKTLYGQHIQAHLQLGKTTDTVISFAEKGSYDLIAMGTKGAWGLKEKLSGSETQMVARRSVIPVLSLMCDRSDLVIENILLVHDFHEQDGQDLELLRKLVKAFGTKVHLLQIIKDESESTREKVLNNMSAFVKAHDLVNTEFHTLYDKDIESGVIHFNQISEMDIICMGTHGKAGLFHTSATEKLINHMFKPIISYHIKSK
jgi:nucleotide-binding universal stress UspA family protein